MLEQQKQTAHIDYLSTSRVAWGKTPQIIYFATYLLSNIICKVKFVLNAFFEHFTLNCTPQIHLLMIGLPARK